MDPMGSNDVGFQKVNHEQEGNARLLQGEVQVGVFFFNSSWFQRFLHRSFTPNVCGNDFCMFHISGNWWQKFK